MNNINSVYIKIIPDSRFEVPINTHLITSLFDIQSLMMCGMQCHHHEICRTADYDPVEKVCRLFETLSSAGTYFHDARRSILALNYCTNNAQTEPEYVCTRSGTFTIQQIFDKLVLAPKVVLPLINRGVYANVHGVYTSSYSGYLFFSIYAGAQRVLANISTEVTNICPVGLSGLAIVQYYVSRSTVYQNIANPSEPWLVPIVNISLPDRPYSCVTTLEYLYVTYARSHIIMTIHNLSTGLIFKTISNNNSIGNRPVVDQWNDTIIIIDQCRITEFTLTGSYQRNWTYQNGFQSNIRNYVGHDYVGRLHICNENGVKPGIYVFLQNGSEIAHGPGNCSRAFQLYITKDKSILVNTPTSGPTMQIINF